MSDFMRSQMQSGEFESGTVDVEQQAQMLEFQRLATEGATDQRLAETLWRSGYHEARLLAVQLADPLRCSRYRLNAWLASAKDSSEVEGVARVAAQTTLAYETALSWIHSEAERTSLAGWSLVAELVTAGKLDAERAAALLECVDEEIPTAKGPKSDAVLKARGALESTFPEIG